MSTATLEHPTQTKILPEIAQAEKPPLVHTDAVHIPVSKIVRSPWNRHATVTDEFIEHIRVNGVLQNVMVRRIKATIAHVTEFAGTAPQPFALGDEIFQLVAGERRWLGAKKAGRATIPAVIRELTDTEAMELQIAENEHREDLNPMDRQRAYAQLVRQYQQDHKGDPKYTRERAIADVAAKVKKGERSIGEAISLERLTPYIKAMLESGELPLSYGYALARRPEEDQERLLRWIKQERDHSHGDLPSVRRLQREIKLIDVENEEKKAQKKLFEGESTQQSAVSTQPNELAGKSPGTASGKNGSGAGSASAPVKAVQPSAPIGTVTFDGKTIELMPGELPASIITELKHGGNMYTRGEIVPGFNPVKLSYSAGCFSHFSVEQLQRMLTQARPPAAKPLTAAAKKKIEEQQAKREEAERKERLRVQRESLIDARCRVLMFLKLVPKLQLNQRTLDLLVPDQLFEAWEDGGFSPALFAQQLLGWPAAKGENRFNSKDEAGDYSYNEVHDYAKKHNKKFSFGLLAALLLYNRKGTAEIERVARYYQVDPKKLRKKAAEEVKAEETAAREPKPTKEQTKHEKQLWAAVHCYEGAEAHWKKLRKTGATDASLRAAIQEYMGNDGSLITKEISVAYKNRWQGSTNPAVWFDKDVRSGKPSLQGAALVQAVRDLMKIPLPEDVDA